MSHAVAIAASCLAAGVVAASLCSLLILPPAVWIAMRALSRPILRMADDAAWQAPFAAIAASLPGAVFLAIAAYGLANGVGSMSLAMPAGRVLFGVIAFLSVVAIVRALVLALRRRLEISHLSAQAHNPSPRLALAARDLSLPVGELDDPEPFCALVGFWRPVILASKGALERLSDDELRAALLHEAAHAKRGDTLLAAAVSLFSDVLPLPADDLIKTYRNARELAADDQAARKADPTDLAAAILAIAKGMHAPPALATLATGDGIFARVRTLLNRGAQTTSPNVPRRLTTGTCLVVVFLVGVAPVAASIIARWTCATIVMR